MSIQPIPPTSGPTTAGQLAARATANDQAMAVWLGDHDDRLDDLESRSGTSVTEPRQGVVRIANALRGQMQHVLGIGPNGELPPHVFDQLEIPDAADRAAMQAILDQFQDTLDATDPTIANRISTPGTQTRAALAADLRLDQIDLVDFVTARAPRYDSARLVRVGSVMPHVRFHDRASKGLIYQFIKDTNDDFIKLDAAYIGFTSGMVPGPTVAATPDDMTGTWTGPSATWYTATPGDSWTLTIPGGNQIDLRLMREPRGGLWSISIDGGTPVEVTSWAASSGTQQVTIAEGLDDVPHTVVGTFLGDDPANPPTSSPSRGYIRGGTDNTLVTYVSGGDAATTDTALARASNKEFAFKSGSAPWMPEHDGVGTCFNIDEPIYYLDGVATPFASWSNDTAAAFSDTFELVQHFHGRVDGVNVAEFWTSHKIDAQGLLTFTGRMVVLQSMSSMTGYPLMLPADSAHAQTFVTGILTRHNSTGDEEHTYFAAEQDAVFSAAVVSSTKRHLVAAGTLDAPRLTYRRGRPGGAAPGEQMFVWNRAEKPKLYFRSMGGAEMSPGDAYTWGFRLTAADISGVYGMLTG